MKQGRKTLKLPEVGKVIMTSSEALRDSWKGNFKSTFYYYPRVLFYLKPVKADFPTVFSPPSSPFQSPDLSQVSITPHPPLPAPIQLSLLFLLVSLVFKG